MPCKHLMVMWILVTIGSDVLVLGYSTVRFGISTTIDYDLADFDEFGKDPGNVDTVNFGGSDIFRGSEGVLNPQIELGYGLDGGARYGSGGFTGGGLEGDYMDPVSDEDIDGPNTSTEDQTPATISITPDNDDNMDAGLTRPTEPTSDPDPDYDDFTKASNNNGNLEPLTSTKVSTDSTSVTTMSGILDNTKNKKIKGHNTGLDYKTSDKDGGSNEISAEQISGQSNDNSSYISREDSKTSDSNNENNTTSLIDLTSENASKSDDPDNSKPTIEDSSVDNSKSVSNANKESSHGRTRNDDSSGDSNTGRSGVDNSSNNNNTSNQDPDTPDDIDNDPNSNKGDASDSNGTNENNDSSGTNTDIDNDSDTVSMEMKSISIDHSEEDSKKTSGKIQEIRKYDDNSLSSCFNNESKAKICQLAMSLYEICNSQFTDKCISSTNQGNMKSGTMSDSSANDPTSSLTAESLQSFSNTYDKAIGIMEILNMIQNLCPGLCSIAKFSKYQDNTTYQLDQSNSATAETKDMNNDRNNDIDNDTSVEDSLEDISADDVDDNTIGESDSADLDYTLDGFYSDDSTNDPNNNSPYNIDHSGSDPSSDVTNVPHQYSATVQSDSRNSGTIDQSNESR